MYTNFYLDIVEERDYLRHSGVHERILKYRLGCWDVDWTYLALGRVHWWTVVNFRPLTLLHTNTRILYYIILYYVVILYYTMLYYIVLFYIILHYFILSYIMLCDVLYYIVLYYPFYLCET